MKTTFLCDETMVITIPIGSLKDISGNQNVPEKFHCVYRDFYKVFVINGKPKPLGAAQAITGVFIVALAVINIFSKYSMDVFNLISLLFVVSGLLSFASGQSPNMQVTKLSFSLNIISFLWSLAAVVFNVITFDSGTQLLIGVRILIMVLLVIESFMTLFLIYWLSKAVCRQHFNTLPVILLKRAD